MLEIVRIISDLLFPPRPTELRIRTAKKSHLGTLYQPGSYYGHYYIGHMSDPLLHAFIIENKYHHSERAATELASLLARWLDTLPQPVVLVPIPLSAERFKARKYNQVIEILRHMPRSHPYCVKERLLTRVRHTAPQTTLQKKDRIQNMKGAFALSKPNDRDVLTSRTIVIIDDVLTTGATLEAARATLAPHLPPNSQLLTVALAH